MRQEKPDVIRTAFPTPKTMSAKTLDRTKKRALIAVAIVFTLAESLIWHGVLASAKPLPKVPVSLGVQAPAKTAPITTPNVQPSVGVPVRLKIPSINVNAAITEVGLAPDGSMGVPKKPHDTAWYDLGPRPGEIGSAVIAGHVNWLYGATGAFGRLKSLKPGARLNVQDGSGSVVSFVVRTSQSYAANADATDIFSSTDGLAHLNLITCDGTWDKRAGQYTKRLVVFADKVE
jgi:LPXTG-site transpeptidase (sortase) family protein